MNKITPIALGITLAVSGFAQAEDGFRQHSAHVHGEVELNIAQDGNELLMEITAPGADVVGFEHAPKTEEQEHALESAVVQLKHADNIFTLAASAGCKITHQSVTHTLGGNDGHHDHDDHHDDHKGHDDHAGHDHHDDHKGHDDHEGHDHHDDHKGHDDHEGHDHYDDHKGHDDHEGHDHHDHGEHASSHGEFTVEYHFECSDVAALDSIDTSWFSHFPTTESIKVNVLTDTKQAALQLNKDNHKISL